MPESSKVESAQSTPISIRAMSSEFSDIESVVSLSDHTSSRANIVPGNPKSAPVHPEFAFPDGNVEIQTTEHTFWVHEYHLNKFSVFAALIQAAKGSETASEPGRRITITCEQKAKGIDVYNTLKVIYASHIDGIPDFDSSIMTSTLRIASTFDYPALRKFAISKLEGMNLPAIERIQLSDEFSLPSWETPAFTELCSRKEPISQTEAEILGMTRFVEIARIRETERTRLAVQFAGGIYGELLQASELVTLLQSEGSDGSGPTQDTFEYSSGRSVLPICNCRPTQRNYGAWTVNLCSLHQVAPQVLKEGQTLIRQRDQLLEKLGNIRSAFNCRVERGDSSPSLGAPDLETELSRASWIRRECAVTS
ncbi:unnamed protein product [Rhizoctonia solani]|uniref:BTB domain-containing protein n=1 Tax=Rhizoctonia solani TaxID=456999 RepID=A0A8H2X608_9AGAM|nr:unnamed protein product [Rhizoctonia solani]